MNSPEYQFLIGTHSHLLRVDLGRDLEVIQCQSLGQGHYYGIGVDYANRVFYARKNSKVCHRYSFDSIERDGVTAFQGEFGKIHQVCFHENGLYIANTEQNSLVFEKFGDPTARMELPVAQDDEYNHINSVVAFPDGVISVLRNQGANCSEIITADSSGGTLTLLQRFELSYLGCHNLLIDGDNTYFNGSRDGIIVQLDTRTGKEKKVKKFDLHTKGMSLLPQYIICGQSEFAQRQDRRTARAGLLVLDRSTMGVVKEIFFDDFFYESRIGNINEVRCVSTVDMAHHREERLPREDFLTSLLAG